MPLMLSNILDQMSNSETSYFLHLFKITLDHINIKICHHKTPITVVRYPVRDWEVSVLISWSNQNYGFAQDGFIMQLVMSFHNDGFVFVYCS